MFLIELSERFHLLADTNNTFEMFDIYLIYVHEGTAHWALRFDNEPEQEDDSTDCYEDCPDNCTEHYVDSDIFYLNSDDNLQAHDKYHTFHVVIRHGDWVRRYTQGDEKSTVMIEEAYLGNCDNADMQDIIGMMDGVTMPNVYNDDNCQVWVYNAIEEVVYDKSNLRGNWRSILASAASCGLCRDDNEDEDGDNEEDEEEN